MTTINGLSLSVFDLDSPSSLHCNLSLYMYIYTVYMYIYTVYIYIYTHTHICFSPFPHHINFTLSLFFVFCFVSPSSRIVAFHFSVLLSPSRSLLFFCSLSLSHFSFSISLPVSCTSLLFLLTPSLSCPSFIPLLLCKFPFSPPPPPGLTADLLHLLSLY